MVKAFAARLRRIADRLDPPAPAWSWRIGTTTGTSTAYGTWSMTDGPYTPIN